MNYQFILQKFFTFIYLGALHATTRWYCVPAALKTETPWVPEEEKLEQNTRVAAGFFKKRYIFFSLFKGKC